MQRESLEIPSKTGSKQRTNFYRQPRGNKAATLPLEGTRHVYRDKTKRFRRVFTPRHGTMKNDRLRLCFRSSVLSRENSTDVSGIEFRMRCQQF